MFGFLKKKEAGNGYGLRLVDYVNPQDSVLQIASKEVVSCREDDRIIDVLASMLAGVRRMPVLGETGEIKGIVSSTDVLDFIGAGEKGKLFTNTGLSAIVKKIMSPCSQYLSATDSIPVALEFFKAHGMPIQPIASQKNLHAVISESDMVNIISRPTGMRVSHVMSQKPFMITEDYAIFDVAKMLCRGPYRRLPVVSKGVATGIVTPHDILSYLNRNESLNSIRLELSPIKSIMSKEVSHVSPEADVHEAVKIMKLKKVSGLPVVNEDMDMLGMLTKKDIIRIMH